MITIDISQKVRNVILRFLPGIDSQSLSDDDNIFNLGLDSINLVSLIFALQEEFELQFSDDEIDFENFKTVHSISGLIAQKKA